MHHAANTPYSIQCRGSPVTLLSLASPSLRDISMKFLGIERFREAIAYRQVSGRRKSLILNISDFIPWNQKSAQLFFRVHFSMNPARTSSTIRVLPMAQAALNFA
jgi:hypothetical protein